MATRDPLIVDRGSHFEYEFAVFDGDGDPVTVSGWTPNCQIRLGPDLPVLHEFTGGNVSVSGSSTVRLIIPAATSRAWAWEFAEYELVVTDLSSRPLRVAEGPVWVRGGIYHP